MLHSTFGTNRRGCSDHYDQWIPFTVFIVHTLNILLYIIDSSYRRSKFIDFINNIKCNVLGLMVRGCQPSRATPKLKDNSFSAVRYCLLHMLATTLHIWRSSLTSAAIGRAVSW